MHNYQIPFIYFPLTVLFVDDNPDILSTLKSTFDSQYKCQTAISAHDALTMVNSSPKSFGNIFSTGNNADNNLDEKTDLHTEFHINIENISSLINCKSKYDNIGVVVIDYNLGDKTGLDLCTEINNKYIQKVLLTGELDISRGINALNNQLIHRYVDKSSANITSELKEYINVLHTAYFNQLYAIPSELLNKSDLYVLDNCEYIEIFENILRGHNIKEFYLIDNKGSFLMLNDLGERFIFNFHTNKSLNEFAEIYSGECPVTTLVEGVKSRNLIPFFGMFNSPPDVEVANWFKCFYTPNKSANFYWNLIKLS